MPSGRTAFAAQHADYPLAKSTQQQMQMNVDEAALQAAAKTLQLATAAGESSSSLEAAPAAMQRAGDGTADSRGALAVALRRITPVHHAGCRPPPPSPCAAPQFEPRSPPLLAPVAIRPHVLGSGTSAFRPTAAALQNQWQARQILHGRAHDGYGTAAASYTPASEPQHQYRMPAMPSPESYFGGDLPSSMAPASAPLPAPGPCILDSHSPPKCRVSLGGQKPGQAQSKPQFNITASSVSGSGRDQLNGLLHAINYLGMQDAAVYPIIRCSDQQPGHAMQAPPRRASGPAYSPLQSPRCGGELSVPSSPPATPPRSSQKIRAGQRSPTKGLRSPTMLRPQGGVSKARTPSLQVRLAHCQRGGRGDAGSASTAGSSPATSSGDSGGADGRYAGGADTTSHVGTWTEEDKAALLSLVKEVKPCGAVEWEMMANRLGRWSKGGASAERMYRTLADPQYKKSSNRHGCRLNPRDGTPMHVMVEYALERLPGNQGNIDAIAKVIESIPEFAKQLDYTARPGTKTYPRWKDSMLGCFKAGRYRHLENTHVKVHGKNMYRLVQV